VLSTVVEAAATTEGEWLFRGTCFQSVSLAPVEALRCIAMEGYKLLGLERCAMVSACGG
jgi:hypothetical protein